MKRHKAFLLASLLAVVFIGCQSPKALAPLEPETLEEKDCTFTPIYFEGNTLIIAPASVPRVEKMAECIRAAFRPIKVSGHSDRMGSRSYREDVGRNRARAVRDALVKHGVVRELVTTTSYGSSRMVCTEEHERCAPMNRRVTIEFQ